MARNGIQLFSTGLEAVALPNGVNLLLNNAATMM